MSAFRDRFQERQRFLDGCYSERLRVIPWLAGDMLAGGPDQSRPSFDVDGVLDLDAKILRVEGAAAVTGGRADIVAPSPRADFDVRVFDGHALPRADWRLQALDRPGQPTFRIAAVEPDGVARVCCPLTPVPA